MSESTDISRAHLRCVRWCRIALGVVGCTLRNWLSRLGDCGWRVNLKDQILQAASFDGATGQARMQIGFNLVKYSETLIGMRQRVSAEAGDLRGNVRKAMKAENARLTPLLECLAEVADAAERSANASGYVDTHTAMADMIEALAKLREVIK